MTRVCEGPDCVAEFAARGRKRFCSDRCRYRAHVAPDKSKVGPKDAKAARKPTPYITRATRLALVRAGRLDTWAGRSAMKLAERLDGSAHETGAAVAAMTEQLAKAMARATEDAAPADPLKARQDEVGKRRRDRERRAGRAG